MEYLDFPTDPRFQRAQHVVNFITHTYSYGGYTKLSGKEHFMIRSGEASVYSKFAYRRMEYDVMVSGDYDYNSHIGSVSDETYRLDPELSDAQAVQKQGKNINVAYIRHSEPRGIRMRISHSAISFHIVELTLR